MAFIDESRDRRTDGLAWGVEPICRVLQFAPSTYYDAKGRPPSRRAVSDAVLKVDIKRVYKENLEVYGAEKIWRQLHREGIACGRDRVARLMGELGIAGVVRGTKKRTTVADDTSEHPGDLVKRNFVASGPDRVWVADIERHEALTNRAVMKRTPPPARRSGLAKLRAA